MVQHHRKNNIYLGFAVIMLMAFLVSGCAVRRLEVTHDPLSNIENKKQGNILVTPFVDKRKEQDLELIGRRVGLQEGVKLDVLLTKFFTEALITAGYKAAIQDAQSATPDLAKYDAIVTGEITEFRMNFYMARVGHRVDISTKALDPASQTVVWDKRIEAAQVNMNWAGATGEFEKVISEALTKALNQAAQAYASDEFFKAIKK